MATCTASNRHDLIAYHVRWPNCIRSLIVATGYQLSASGLPKPRPRSGTKRGLPTASPLTLFIEISCVYPWPLEIVLWNSWCQGPQCTPCSVRHSPASMAGDAAAGTHASWSPADSSTLSLSSILSHSHESFKNAIRVAKAGLVKTLRAVKPVPEAFRWHLKTCTIVWM